MAKKTTKKVSKKNVEKKVEAKPVVKKQPNCQCGTELTLLKYSDYGPEWECKVCKRQYSGHMV